MAATTPVMHIACPTCARRYTVDPARIGPEGRRVRCAGCRESWFVTLPTSELPSLETGDLAFGFADPARSDVASGPVPASAEDGRPDPDIARVVIEPDRDEGFAPARSRTGRRKSPRGGGWRRDAATRPASPGAGLRRTAMAACLALAVGVPAVLAGRTALVRALPGTGSLFAAFGLPVNVLGLRLVDVSSTLSSETGAPVLVVMGGIANETAEPIKVPPLLVTVEGEAGDELYAWTTTAPGQDLAAGAQTTFRAPLASPPPAGRRVRLTFRDAMPAGKVASR